MQGLLDLQGPLSLQQTGLRILILTIVGLVLVSVAFGLYTVVLRIQHIRKERRWTRLTARWEEPLLLALTDPEEVDRVHQAVEPGDRLHFVQFVLDYAKRVVGEERQMLRTLAAPYLGPIVERATHPRREIRTRAVRTLGTLGLPRHAGEVLAALDDPSPLVAMVAAQSLAKEEFPEYVPAILKRLARFRGWSQAYMASMLASIGSAAAPALRDSLVDEDEEPWVRAVAADALYMLKDFESGDLAARVVELEEDSDLLASALKLLTEVGQPEHVEAIRVRCASPDPLVRSRALSALGTLGEEDDIPTILGAMSDPSPWVAIRAAKGVLAAGAAQLLRDLAYSDHPRAELARQVLLEAGEE